MTPNGANHERSDPFPSPPFATIRPKGDRNPAARTPYNRASAQPQLSELRARRVSANAG